mgnify:CR=1 FL=1
MQAARQPATSTCYAFNDEDDRDGNLEYAYSGIQV